MNKTSVTNKISDASIWKKVIVNIVIRLSKFFDAISIGSAIILTISFMLGFMTTFASAEKTESLHDIVWGGLDRSIAIAFITYLIVYLLWELAQGFKKLSEWAKRTKNNYD